MDGVDVRRINNTQETWKLKALGSLQSSIDLIKIHGL